MTTRRKSTPKESLAEAVWALNETIKNTQSLKQRFFGGVLRGLGVALGTTLVAGGIIYGLSFLLNSLDLEQVANEAASDIIQKQLFQQ